MKNKTRNLLILGLVAIAVLYLVSAFAVFERFQTNLSNAEIETQHKMIHIVNQSLNLYFEKLKFIVENAALDPVFSAQNTAKEDALRFKTISPSEATALIKKYGITRSLSEPTKAVEPTLIHEPLASWQIFKGLPPAIGGKEVAINRRVIARNILRAFGELHYVFEMEENGNLVFLEPFEIQKNITSFNYEYRDYLRLAKKYRATSLSEGYISHDQNRTQIITVATPLFSSTGEVVKIFAASVSAATLREKVFMQLKEHMDLDDGTVFYLVDRHGHIVASSSGKDIYFPIDGVGNDENDSGNIRNYGFFKNVDWVPDTLEKGNVWERGTKSWQLSSLKKDFSGEYVNFKGEKVYGSFFPTSIIGSQALNWGILIETPKSKLYASAKSMKMVFGVVFTLLLLLLTFLSWTVLKQFNFLTQELNSKEKEIHKFSAQVAHDIRSPLAALDIAIDNLPQIPDNLRTLIKKASERIKDIANNLLTEKKNSFQEEKMAAPVAVSESKTIQLASTLIDEVVSESRMRFSGHSGVEIKFDTTAISHGLFIEVQPIEFSRSLTNLINNAVEALNEKGLVEVRLTTEGQVVQIEVLDNGKGIPPEILGKIGKRGVTFGKSNGNGLGLAHSIECVKSWGGDIHVVSNQNSGTSITISLPKSNPPFWFVPSIELSDFTQVVIVDDDASIHEMWKQKLSSTGHETVEYFSSPSAFQEWYALNKNTLSEVLFLVDYEFLGQKTNGLELILKNKIASKSILVTNKTLDEELVLKCFKSSIRMIPKSSVRVTPVFQREHITLDTPENSLNH